MPKKTLKNCTVADAYLAVLADRGVDYLFANAGTDFAPLIEALAKAQALGTPFKNPEIPLEELLHQGLERVNPPPTPFYLGTSEMQRSPPGCSVSNHAHRTSRPTP